MSRQIIRLNDFAKAGINSDLLPWDLDGNYLTEVSNARINKGKLSPFGGEEDWVDLPLGFVPGYCINVTSNNGSYWVVPGLDAVYSYDGGSFVDITSVEGYASISDENLWQGDMMSNILVINNPGHHPEYWATQDGSDQLLPLPWDDSNSWSDAGQSCDIMRSHKQYLFALGLYDNGISITDGVRWSSPADINSIPETWDPLDITNVAGITNLGGKGGKIVDGLSMRDAFCVYRESGITVFDYVGGTFVWQVRHLSSDVGLISPDSIVEVKGAHYFIGNGDIYINNGNSVESILHNRLHERFVSNYDPDNFKNSFTILNTSSNEIWFCVPESGNEFPNISYVYNWRDDSWTIRDIPSPVFAAYGKKGTSTVSWEDMTNTWDSGVSPWGQRQLTPLDGAIVSVQKPGANPSGKMSFLDITPLASDSDFTCTVERTGFALDGLNQVTTITSIYPHMKGPGIVTIQLGSQDATGSNIRWKPAIQFDPNSDRKVDIRTTGELHCFRFSSSNEDGYWELSGMDIEYVQSGVR